MSHLDSAPHVADPDPATVPLELGPCRDLESGADQVSRSEPRPARFHARRVTCATYLLLASLLVHPTRAATHLDDFEDGANETGWAFIRGGDVIEVSGGNPGGWLHQPVYDTFAPSLETRFSAPTPFCGDYEAMGVSRISLDAQTLHVDFGNGDGFQLSLMLRDAKGTPSDFDDDDYVYFVGPNVPRVGEGWVHYDFDIPSDFSGTLPPGWKGGWAWDCETLRPGVTWNDVIRNVERVEIWWLDPCLFAIFQQWNVGADNLAIEYGDPASVEPIVSPRPELWVSPNPMTAGTTIRLQLDGPRTVTVDVLSVDGRHVASIASGLHAYGTFEAVWDGRDDRGREVPNGTYLIQARTEAEQATRRVTRIR